MGQEFGVHLACTVIDCHDPDRLAQFWTEAFGWIVSWRRGPYVGIRPPDTKDLREPSWLFQRVAEPKRGKNRCHQDFRISGDFVAAVRRVIELGGRRVPGYETGGFLVMADPEGNEFCLIPDERINMDDEGHVDYLVGPFKDLGSEGE